MNQVITGPLAGVALVVRNWKGEILLIKEKVTKPRLGKYAGTWSFPMETLYSHEMNDHQAGLMRLIGEEISYLSGRHILPPFTLQGSYLIAPCARAWLYGGWTYRVDAPPLPIESEEIAEYRWFDPAETPKLWLRQGMPEMLEDFLAGQTGVNRDAYRPAVLPENQPTFA